MRVMVVSHSPQSMTKMNGIVMHDRCALRRLDERGLVDGLWMTCVRLVQQGGYLRTLFLAVPLWQLTSAHVSLTGQAVTT